jgi:hypothetical protein
LWFYSFAHDCSVFTSIIIILSRESGRGCVTSKDMQQLLFFSQKGMTKTTSTEAITRRSVIAIVVVAAVAKLFFRIHGAEKKERE